MTDKAGDELGGREQDVHRQPDEGGAQAAFKAVGLHGELLTTKRTK
jgi:hypothetical protein